MISMHLKLITHDQAPVPLSIFRSNSKFDENSKHSSEKCIRPITTIFCTRQCHCRDVCKISLWSVEYIRNYRVLNFHQISNSIEICLVGRAPVLLLQACSVSKPRISTVLPIRPKSATRTISTTKPILFHPNVITVLRVVIAHKSHKNNI